MNRLFLRVYLSVLSAAVLGMVIALQVAHQTTATAGWEYTSIWTFTCGSALLKPSPRAVI